MQNTRRSGGRKNLIALALPLAGLSAVIALLGLTGASAGTLAGTEIDADQLAPGDALYSQTADDWAETGGSAAEGVMLLGTSGNPDFTDCYGSDLSINPAINGTAGFICDGSTDSRFDGSGGDSECDAFWGFELDQVPPTRFGDLVSNGGGTFDLDFNRTPGDLLISFTLTGGGTNPVLEVFSWNGSTFELLVPTLCPGGSQGDSLLRTNPANDIQAPPWNVPACDPTSTNPVNACRIVNQNGTAPAQPGDNRLAPRDFNEAIVDLSAFVSGSVCFHSLLFTSRSAHPLETADLKDVGGADVNTCPPPPAPPAAPPPVPAPPGAPSAPGAPGAPPGATASLWLMTGAVAAAAGLIVLTRSRRR